MESFKANRKGLDRQNPQTTLKPVPIFGSIQGDFIHRHHNEPQVQLHVPKEETFPVPLKYIDVARSTLTDLDVLQEKRIDAYWNVDWSARLSDSWQGLTKFNSLKENLPEGCMCSGERLTKIQATTRPDHVWPEIWVKIFKPLRIENNNNWQKKKNQSLTVVED